MKKRNLYFAVLFIAAFVLWTALVSIVDVKPIGPQDSSVGFSALNGAVHRLTGVNMTLYTITDWLGLIPIGVALGFAILGLVQLITRRSLLKVDSDVLALGAFYVAVIVVYVFFEIVVVNYRPILIEGRLEASYPSSTTMLASCVIPTAAMQFKSRIKGGRARKCVVIALALFTAFMVIGRILSGVHWITDIIGGTLISAGLVMAYGAFAEINFSNFHLE